MLFQIHARTCKIRFETTAPSRSRVIIMTYVILFLVMLLSFLTLQIRWSYLESKTFRQFFKILFFSTQAPKPVYGFFDLVLLTSMTASIILINFLPLFLQKWSWNFTFPRSLFFFLSLCLFLFILASALISTLKGNLKKHSGKVGPLIVLLFSVSYLLVMLLVPIEFH